MNYLLALIPVLVSFYTLTYGVWAWRKGNRFGGAGVFCLAAVTMAVSFYAIFIRPGF